MDFKIGDKICIEHGGYIYEHTIVDINNGFLYLSKGDVKMNFKVGDVVYFNYFDFIREATIVRIKGDFADLKWTDGGSNTIRLTKLYHTNEECLHAMKLKSEQTIQNYKSQIKTVEDLVEFMYNNCVACAEEYTDWDARKAAAERAKELLNIDLEV